MLNEIIAIVQECLQIEDSSSWDETTELIGALAEFDSMAVVTVITQVEENYGFIINDDEISAEVFETIGTLTAFIEQKI
ncbi:MAG: acyl carrier protein [Gammaproteobacteria bacterium]|nr:acyl carrier protein [Gammaproteobacteria bacterium]